MCSDSSSGFKISRSNPSHNYKKINIVMIKYISRLFISQIITQEIILMFGFLLRLAGFPVDSFTEVEQAPDNAGMLSGFTTSFLAILVSQIGDKTFFLAMIMAMRYNKFIVFLGAYGALAIMTVLSTIFGEIITKLISPTITNIIVTILFLYFGVRMIYEAMHHEDEEENQEMKEVEIELKEMEQKFIERSSHNSQNVTPSIQQKQKKNIFPNSFIFGKAFIMTFLAQWGDRSQFATIALAASFNAFMVTFGALLGHLICTAGAVQIGSWISSRVKQKHVLMVGGIVFILSGIATLLLVIG